MGRGESVYWGQKLSLEGELPSLWGWRVVTADNRVKGRILVSGVLRWLRRSAGRAGVGASGTQAVAGPE